MVLADKVGAQFDELQDVTGMSDLWERFCNGYESVAHGNCGNCCFVVGQSAQIIGLRNGVEACGVYCPRDTNMHALTTPGLSGANLIAHARMYSPSRVSSPSGAHYFAV